MASTSMAALLAQAEEAGISSFEPSPGTYTLRVASANGGKTKKEDPKFGVQYEIQGGPDNGKKFWTNINLTAIKNDGTSNSFGLAMSFKDLAALGADAATVAGWDVDSPAITEQVQAALVGTVVTADVSTRQSGGYTNIDVKKIRPVAGGTPATPAPSAAEPPSPPLPFTPAVEAPYVPPTEAPVPTF